MNINNCMKWQSVSVLDGVFAPQLDPLLRRPVHRVEGGAEAAAEQLGQDLVREEDEEGGGEHQPAQRQHREGGQVQQRVAVVALRTVRLTPLDLQHQHQQCNAAAAFSFDLGPCVWCHYPRARP